MPTKATIKRHTLLDAQAQIDEIKIAAIDQQIAMCKLGTFSPFEARRIIDAAKLRIDAIITAAEETLAAHNIKAD